MARISEETVGRVHDAARIAEVVGETVQLRRYGAGLMGCCPFHSERTPSFYVNPARNRYICFGCGEKGSPADFIMKTQNVGYPEAVERLARRYNIEVVYDSEQTEEQRQAAHRREVLLAALNATQEFFVAQLAGDTPEASAARQYAYNRWGEQFCREFGLGLAPQKSSVYLDYVRRQCIPEDALKELGLIATGERGDYAFFYNRLTIPIRDRLGRVIAFTARYMGDDYRQRGTGKYINSTTSLLFKKDATLFGIDVARRSIRKAGESVVVVEGAPDVMRLQSVGVPQAVAPLGTALCEKHLEQIADICKEVCFIPDSDPPKGKAEGAGVQAVMRSGTLALKAGLSVSVREIPRTTEEDEQGTKHDPDSYIRSRDDFDALEAVPFVVWLARKRFAAVEEQQKMDVLREVAALLAGMDDKIKVDYYVTEELSRLFGKVAHWRSAIKEAQRLAATPRESTDKPDEREQGLRHKFGIIVRNNMYYSPDKDGDLSRWSNFVLRPVFHVKNTGNARRVFRIINEYGQEEAVELRQAELNALPKFQTKIGSLGNYVWKAKQEQLNTLFEYLYAITDTADEVECMGWNARERYYAFANGLFINDKWMPANDIGIVKANGKCYYLPALSKMYAHDEGAFDFERMFEHRPGNGATLRDFVQMVVDVFGDGGKVGFAYVLAAMFRDYIKGQLGYFPILNLFGRKGTGKTALAVALSSFFYTIKNDPPKLATATVPSMAYMLSHAQNAVIVLDEYKNDLDLRRLELIKGAWGGVATTKMNMEDDMRIKSVPVHSGVIVCGQDLPTRDVAIYSRCIHVAYSRVEFTQGEKDRFDMLRDAKNRGNTHLTMQILRHRDSFTENYRAMFTSCRNELLDHLAAEQVEDRIFNNWVVPLAAFRTLEAYIDVPFNYMELFDICLRGIRSQNSQVRKNSEIAEFWKLLDAQHMQGLVHEKAHFVIKYQTRFRGLGKAEAMEFGASHPVIYLNFPAVTGLFNQRPGISGATFKIDTASLDSYLRNSPQYLGLKQQRFNVLQANGTPDFILENNEKRLRSVRPKAMCFDYAMLKDAFDLNLETLLTRENDYEPDEDDAPPQLEQQPEFEQSELPF